MPVHRFAAALLLALAGTAEVVAAQAGLPPGDDRPRVLVGYVANAPEMMLGGTVAALPAFLGGWGIYLDAKRGLENPGESEFLEPEITPAEAKALGHPAVQEKSYWRSLNAAVVRAFRDDLILYLGGGAAREQGYVEYFDESQTRGNFGYYWVRDDAVTGSRPNVMGGMYFRLMRHIAVQFGLESTPAGVTVGVVGAF